MILAHEFAKALLAMPEDAVLLLNLSEGARPLVSLCNPELATYTVMGAPVVEVNIGDRGEFQVDSPGDFDDVSSEPEAGGDGGNVIW